MTAKGKDLKNLSRDEVNPYIDEVYRTKVEMETARYNVLVVAMYGNGETDRLEAKFRKAEANHRAVCRKCLKWIEDHKD